MNEVRIVSGLHSLVGDRARRVHDYLDPGPGPVPNLLNIFGPGPGPD